MKEYLPVNWVDGMKINKTHFIAQFNANTYQQALGLSAFVTNINYGLVPDSNTGNSVKIFVSVDNQQHVNVRALHCTAITTGGYTINFVDGKSVSETALNIEIPELSIPLDSLSEIEKEYFILISVSPYDRVPNGIIDKQEMPPRLPFTSAKYMLHLLPAEEVNANNIGPFLLPVGKIKVADQNVALQENYVPPSVVVNSHPILRETHANWIVFLGKLELLSLQIIQKIIVKKQQNELSNPIHKTCDNILNYLSAQYDSFKSLCGYSSPLNMITVIAGLARCIKNSFDIYLGSSKEELFKYIDETCGVKQAELESASGAVCNLQYNHFDIAASIEKAGNFIKLTDRLFTSLLSLDYIGKRKEAGIFVKEQVIADRSKFGNFLVDE